MSKLSCAEAFGFQNLKWLNGHPPEIRLRGDSENWRLLSTRRLLPVKKNGQIHGPWVGRPRELQNILRRETAFYELINPPTIGRVFRLSTYKRTAPPRGYMNICGPVVKQANQDTVLLVRTGSTYLLGAVPGQIAFAAPAFDLRFASILGSRRVSGRLGRANHAAPGEQVNKHRSASPSLCP